MAYGDHIRNLLRGADAADGANAARAAQNAKRRAKNVGEAMFDDVSPVLMNPEVLATLPADLAARVKLGEPSAILEGVSYLMRSKGIPRNIPADAQLSRMPYPGAEAGFQRGEYGGRVPTDSAGEMIVRPETGMTGNPGAEAGFRVDGVPDQVFDPTGLVPLNRGMVPYVDAIDVQMRPRRRDGSSLPWLIGGGTAVAAGLGNYLTRDGSDVAVAPEENVPEMMDEGLPPAPSYSQQDVDAAVSAIMSDYERQMGMEPARPEGELWGSQGERSMEYALGPDTPQARTRDALLDAGIEPRRAEAIARGQMSMTQMERDAVIGNSGARRQRMSDQIQSRRNARMGSY